MKRPNRRILTEIARYEISYRDLRDIADIEDDEEEDEDEELYGIPYGYHPLSAIAPKLSDSMKLENCYISQHIDDYSFVTLVIHDGGPNPNYDAEMKEFEEWKTKAHKEELKKNLERQAESLQRQLKTIERQLKE